jgi:hypothetical protein
MSVEVDHTSQPRFQDGSSQVFWTIGSDHRLYRIELSHRGAKAVAANTPRPVLGQPASGGSRLIAGP